MFQTFDTQIYSDLLIQKKLWVFFAGVMDSVQ